MQFENVVYEKEGHVATVTLNRPERGNAMSNDLDAIDLALAQRGDA